MGKTREIKGRLKAVGNIKRITKTMQMIATSKFAKAQIRATAAKPFTEGVFELVQELAATAGDIDHPLIKGPSLSDAELASRPELVLVITSDRGLCGPYNNNVLRMARTHLQALPVQAVTELVGKKGAAFLRFNGLPVSEQRVFGDDPRREEIERLADEFMEKYTSGEVSAVRIAYTRFISAGRQAPELLQLLPLKPPTTDDSEAKGPSAVYEFTPQRDELLNDLLPAAVKATLNQCFHDAIVSEHVARMIAMKAATDAAGRMSKDLARTFNRARQAQITTELTEIIGGVAALE